MPTRLVTPPTLKPLSVAALKTHLRIDHADEDEYLAALIDVATQFVEERAWRALLTQTREIAMDEWPGGREIELPFAPIQSVASVKYITSQGMEVIVAPENFALNAVCEPGRLVLQRGASWPNGELAATGGVRVQYVCGWDEASKIPPSLVHAVRIMCGHLYENREVAITGTIITQVPEGINALIEPFRLLRF
ncbi:MAG: head-tail connector protein [Anaerolineae bacterium]